MPQCVLSATVSRVRTIATPTPDALLVSAFAGGDDEAFAELVRRHGPMVLGVCRKITRHAQDAEDAAQAAFLVLARRAGTIRAAGVASWLFGVAVNTAREARRRTARHASTATVPEYGRFDPDPDFDTRAAIAEELAKLPDRYRELVVRCDLEGESQAAVARRIGLPVGTVYSRLSTARSILAGRLTRRGIAAGVAVLAFTRGAAFAASDCPNSRVTELTEAVMRTTSGWKWAAVVAVAVGVAVAASGKPERAEAPLPRPKAESRLVVMAGGHLRYLSPGGTLLSRVTGNDAARAGADIHTMTFSLGLSSDKGFTTEYTEEFPTGGRIAPDGRIPLATNKGLYLLIPGGAGELVKGSEADGPSVIAWTRDAKKALLGLCDPGGYFTRPKYEHAILDVASGTRTPLTLPEDHYAIDWSPDGSWILTIRQKRQWAVTSGWVGDGCGICKVSADGKKVTGLTDSAGAVFHAAISPDGKTVAYLDYLWVKSATLDANGKSNGYAGVELVVLNLTTGAKATLVREPGGARADGKSYHVFPGGLRWSPDGTRIAFAHDHTVVGKPMQSEWRLDTIAPDGTDTATVMKHDRTAHGTRWVRYTLIDWR